MAGDPAGAPEHELRVNVQGFMEDVGGEYDVVVVGGGIMGSCSAFECARRGLTVVLLEQFDFLHRRGSSHGESRTIRRTYPEDWYTQMMPQAYALWEEAGKEAGYSPLTTTGSLDFGHSTSADLLSLISACKAHSVPHDVLSTTELRERYPYLSFPEDSLGVFCPEGGVLHATKACAMFQQLAVKHGARVVDRVTVKDIQSVGGGSEGEMFLDADKDGVVVQTSKGAFKGRSCVLACGAWTSPLVKRVSGVDLPVQPLQVYSSYWRVKPAYRESLKAVNGCPVFLYYGKEELVYSSPMLEYQGSIKISSHSGRPCDPDNRPVEKPVVEPMQRWLKEWLGDAVELEPALVEACMYSMTPDQDFIVDTLQVSSRQERAGDGLETASKIRQGVQPGSKQPPCVVVAAGFSGHGFKFGPLIGAVVGDLVERGTSDRVPIELFSISRFENGKQGNARESGPQVRTHVGSD